MKLLLDTCAALWLATGRSKFSATARAVMTENSDQLFVSAISAFEIGLKQRKGRLLLEDEASLWWSAFNVQHGVQVVSVSDTIALASTSLPFLHGDPCDRIIIATAATLGMAIITSDRLIAQYPQAPVIW